MENLMNLQKTLFILLVSIGLTGCGTMAQIWETGTEVVSNTVDTVVTGASDLVTAVGTDVVNTGAFIVDTGAGVVQGVSERVDEETDKLDGDNSEGK
jgi:starvation-inducible outer membrane lipoprotein